MRAETGAEALHAVADPFIPPQTGKDWRTLRRKWFTDNVRLNVTQIA